jgi:SAM-dependent MidA family methyltransferase
LAGSIALTALLVEAIAAGGGFLPFSRYMQRALYEPALGYYQREAMALGAEGDFTTAPEQTPLFARTLARTVADLLHRLGGGALVEHGPGSGALCCELLRALAALDALPERYVLCEISAVLRARQQRAVEALPAALAARVEWQDAAPPGLRGVIIANELLDALPVELFEVRTDGVWQCGIGCVEGALRWFARPAPAELAQAVAAIEKGLGRPLAPGYRSEVCLTLAPWLAGQAAALSKGALLLFDYGYPRSAYYLPERSMGTLVAHYRHRLLDEPLRWPGLCDLTAHVDWDAVAEAGSAAGLQLAGFAPLARFLISAGLLELLAAEPQATAAAKPLLLPGGYGERFQMLAFTRGLDWTAPV